MANKPQIVRRVSVAPSDLMMAVPPFIDQHGANEDKELANGLLRVTRETRVLLGQFFLYVAMTRSKEFANACNASDAKEGAAIVVGSLMRTMVVTIAALFDEDGRTSNVPKTLRTALSPARTEFLRKFHEHYGVEAESQKSRERLVRYGRSIRSGALKAAIRRVVNVRNTFVAHIDFSPPALGEGERAIVRDFDHVISAAAIIVGETNVFVLGRRIDVAGLRKILREEAGGLVSTLKRGFQLL
jgi:hypothetical protein